MAYAWGTLLKYVRTGASAYQDVFGTPFWEDLDAHPEVGASFDALMGEAGHGVPDPDIQLAAGWDAVRTVVDVGGGTGGLLAQILRTRQRLRAIGKIFRARRWVSGDLPGRGRCRPCHDRRAEFLRPVAGRGRPLSADEDPQRLARSRGHGDLHRCAEAARPHGRILISGGVSDDAAPRGLSIEMVLLGTRQRSVAKFRELAATAASLSFRRGGSRLPISWWSVAQPDLDCNSSRPTGRPSGLQRLGGAAPGASGRWRRTRPAGPARSGAAPSRGRSPAA